MDNDLLDLYEQHYLGTKPIINESTESEKDEVETEIVEEAKKKNFKKKFKKGDDKKAKKNIGGITYDSFSQQFDKIIKEEFGEDDAPVDDSSFSTDDSYEFGADEGGGEQVSVSKATLQSIVDQLQGLIGDDMDEGEGDLDADAGLDETDQIPQESYAFEGGGKEKGMQGNYDGKARPQGKSTHVKDNGDVNFNDQDTGYDPDDTEGSEGAEHGMQGNYDGKAKPQGKTDLVKGDGSIDKSKQKHSAKTSSGKKDKNYF